MFRVVGIIIWVLGGISSLMFFISIGDGISFLAAIINCISSFLNGLVFWSLGTLFEEVDDVRNLVYSMKNNIMESIKTPTSKTSPEQVKPNMIPLKDKEWICPKCQATNSSSSIICKVCGKYR